MNCLEDFLKGNDGDHGSGNLLVTGNRCGDSQSHFLAGTNNLRATDNQFAAIHPGQYFTNSLINLFALNQLWLKRSVHFAFDGTDRERNQIWIVLKDFL